MESIKYALSVLLGVGIVVALVLVILAVQVSTKKALVWCMNQATGPCSPLLHRWEMYAEDAAMEGDYREAFAMGRPTLLSDIAWVRFLVRRWLFAQKYAVITSVGMAYYRHTTWISPRRMKAMQDEDMGFHETF